MATATKPKPKKATKGQLIQRELERIRKRNEHGLLVPQEVLEVATDPRNILHKEIQWDDKKAAHAHRLDQVRSLIRVYVDAVSHTPTYVSLTIDRANKSGGGYRRMQDVLDHKAAMAELAKSFDDELGYLLRRYRVLTSKVAAVAKAAGIADPNDEERPRVASVGGSDKRREAAGPN